MALYIEFVWPHEERPGGTPDSPMDRASKGSTNPPVGEWVHALMWSNRVASGYLSRELEVVRKGKVKASNGIHQSRVLMDLRYDSGLVQTWRDSDPAMLQAFRETCHNVARGVVFIRGARKDLEEMERRINLDYDDPEAFVVRHNPTDESLEVVMPDEFLDPDDPGEAVTIESKAHRYEVRGRTRKGQKIDTMHTRRLMVEQLEQLEASTHYRGDEAIEVLAERKQKEGRDWTFSKIRDAKTAVNKERREEAGEVA